MEKQRACLVNLLPYQSDVVRPRRGPCVCLLLTVEEAVIYACLAQHSCRFGIWSCQADNGHLRAQGDGC